MLKVHIDIDSQCRGGADLTKARSRLEKLGGQLTLKVLCFGEPIW
jgi:hypothetical protein